MNISQKKLEKSKGRLEIKIKDQNLQKLYQQGSLKALMPDFHENLKQLMLINTAGGITSGDEYDFKFEFDNSNLKKAIFTVILADITMSLDNVLGVAGAAKDHYTLLAFGLILSILLMAFAANYTAKLIKKYSWISWVGLIAILIVAVQLIYEDLQILL